MIPSLPFNFSLPQQCAEQDRHRVLLWQDKGPDMNFSQPGNLMEGREAPKAVGGMNYPALCKSSTQRPPQQVHVYLTKICPCSFPCPCQSPAAAKSHLHPQGDTKVSQCSSDAVPGLTHPQQETTLGVPTCPACLSLPHFSLSLEGQVVPVFKASIFLGTGPCPAAHSSPGLSFTD